MILPTPTASGLARQRTADFETVQDALEYAARGASGLNFYSGRGELLEVLPYSRLRADAIDLGRRMLAAGLAPGDRAALIAETDGDFVRSFFACIYAGLIPVPLPLPTTVGGKDAYIANLRRMVQSAGAVAAIGPASLDGWLSAAVEGLSLKFQGAIAAFDRSSGSIDLPPADPGSLLYIQFSSGSTRFPLGIAVTQRALMANARGIGAHGLAVTETDRCVSWLPLYHDMGLVGFLLAPMLSQLSVDLIQTREFARRPLLWLDIITRNGGTISYSPTFGYELCVRRAETAPTDGFDLRTWRIAGVGGDMVRPDRLGTFVDAFAPRGFRGRSFLASYGMAEATLALSFAPLDGGLATERVDIQRLEQSGVADAPDAPGGRVRDFVRCGPALPGHLLEVRDAVGRVLPERRVGRIFARGPSLMHAYFGRPAETTHVLSTDGWLDTGDLGFMAAGEIVITGRAKDLILVNGRNVWPQDLEWTIESEIEVVRTGDVVAFALDTAAEEQVVVLAQCRLSDKLGRAALQDEITRVVRARHGLDVAVTLVPPRALPQTSSGKLSRAQAKEIYGRGLFTQQEAAEATG